jgi:hypothetical protein
LGGESVNRHAVARGRIVFRQDLQWPAKKGSIHCARRFVRGGRSIDSLRKATARAPTKIKATFARALQKTP